MKRLIYTILLILLLSLAAYSDEYSIYQVHDECNLAIFNKYNGQFQASNILLCPGDKIAIYHFKPILDSNSDTEIPLYFYKVKIIEVNHDEVIDDVNKYIHERPTVDSIGYVVKWDAEVYLKLVKGKELFKSYYIREGSFLRVIVDEMQAKDSIYENKYRHLYKGDLLYFHHRRQMMNGGNSLYCTFLFSDSSKSSNSNRYCNIDCELILTNEEFESGTTIDNTTYKIVNPDKTNLRLFVGPSNNSTITALNDGMHTLPMTNIYIIAQGDVILLSDSKLKSLLPSDDYVVFRYVNSYYHLLLTSGCESNYSTPQSNILYCFKFYDTSIFEHRFIPIIILRDDNNGRHN